MNQCCYFESNRQQEVNLSKSKRKVSLIMRRKWNSNKLWEKTDSLQTLMLGKNWGRERGVDRKWDGRITLNGHGLSKLELVKRSLALLQSMRYRHSDWNWIELVEAFWKYAIYGQNSQNVTILHYLRKQNSLPKNAEVTL